jgi:hypothetical protein
MANIDANEEKSAFEIRKSCKLMQRKPTMQQNLGKLFVQYGDINSKDNYLMEADD